MTRYIGLDVHKHFLEACILDDQGKVLFRGRAECERAALERFARQRLSKTDRVALEATTNTWPVVEILAPFVAAVVVSNPLKTRAIAEAKVKTDKVDAEVLAHLLHCDYLPEVWRPDEETQMLRSLITHRTGLVRQRTQHKNRIQCLLGRLLLQPPCKALWTKAGLAWLKAVELSPTERLVLESELRQIKGVEEELAELDKQLIVIARREPRVRLLMTLPGVSYVAALGLLAALGDITRFSDGDHAASYLGLAPVTRQSGARCYHGHITKAGNSQARALLTQACQHVTRHPGPLGAFFRRLAKRKNRQVAIVATARKLVTIAYLMLKHNEPYRYAKPQLMADKFATLDRASDEAGKPHKQTPSLRSQARSGLAAVYAQAGLPPATEPAQLPAGEQQMLKRCQLNDFAQELYSPTASQQIEERPTHKKPSSAETGRRTGRPR